MTRHAVRKLRSRATTIAPHATLWVVFDERVKLGTGRAQLLELIDHVGSIGKAVARAGTEPRGAISRNWRRPRGLSSSDGATR